MRMRVRRKTVKGRFYYYLEETLRLEKPEVYSVFLGKKIPGKRMLAKHKQKLREKIYSDLLGNAQKIFLAKEQLIEAEMKRRQFNEKTKKMGISKRDEKDEVETVNFVYTTLSTEGILITKADANLAYKISQKSVHSVREESLKVALDMIKGLREVKESRKGVSLDFIEYLHRIIMAEYKEKNPGKYRMKQAYIYLKSYEKVEEIGFRPSAPKKIKKELEKLVEWYNSSMGKLNAIEFAALFHLRFYMIHPFEDGNKRMSRLLLNKALQDAGYPILNISKNTEKYFDALVKSVEKKDEKPFVLFVFNEFLQSMRK
ncbi:MAG: Fic family protein [Candidatus Micrarchaeota archaeon]